MLMKAETENIFEKFKDDFVILMPATGKYIVFRDGIDGFNRSYNINWDSVDVYGRQDAIQTYQSTGEVINITWPLKPRTNPEEYNLQLEAILALGKFARPFYSGGIIQEAPLLLIKYRNLIVENYEEDSGSPLLIAPNSISVDYGDRARDDVSQWGDRRIVVPKRINLSLSGVVINTTNKYYSTASKDSSADETPVSELATALDEFEAEIADGAKDDIVGAEQASITGQNS